MPWHSPLPSPLHFLPLPPIPPIPPSIPPKFLGPLPFLSQWEFSRRIYGPKANHPLRLFCCFSFLFLHSFLMGRLNKESERETYLASKNAVKEGWRNCVNQLPFFLLHCFWPQPPFYGHSSEQWKKAPLCMEYWAVEFLEGMPQGEILEGLKEDWIDWIWRGKLDERKNEKWQTQFNKSNFFNTQNICCCRFWFPLTKNSVVANIVVSGINGHFC